MDVFTSRWNPDQGVDVLPEPDDRATLLLVFGDSGILDDPEPLHRLLARYPRAVAMGCSTAGQIVGDSVFDTADDGALAVAVARFDHTRLVVSTEPLDGPDGSFRAGMRLADQLTAAEPELAAVAVLSDGLDVNGSAVAKGLVAGTQGRVPVSGGLAADGDRFERTWVLSDGVPRQGVVTALGLAGPKVQVRQGSQGGWEGFGPLRTITRAEGNVLYELDGEPALELYERYLGDRAAGLPATALLFPLAVRPPDANGRHVVRTVLSIDRSTKSMAFAGDVPVGSTAQLMTAGLGRLISGAGAAAADARPPAAAGQLAVAVSCVGRRLVLGRRTEDELEAALDQFPPNTGLIGFYSYGELTAVGSGGCDLQNQTMTITTIAEVG